jgi:hypothetical protein
VNFDFAVVVELVGGVAVAGEADVAAVGAFAVEEFALVVFDVGLVFTFAELGGVVVVVVEDRGDAGLEGGVIGDLDDDVVVDAGLGVEVPDGDGGDFGGCAEVDLDPLRGRPELDVGAVVPDLSPSLMNVSSPMTGRESLLVTVLPLERLTVPLGTMRSGRLPVRGFSRLGSAMGRGVPAKSGLGSSIWSGTVSAAWAAPVRATRARRRERRE